MRHATLALVVLLALSPPALAVECGDVLLADTALDHDLECTEVGLYIGAHGITLDLGGYRVAGAPSDSSERPAVGIVNAGFDDVEIRNGIVSGFEQGVLLLDGVERNALHNLVVTGNASGIALHDTHASVVARNDTSDNDLAPGSTTAGIRLFDSHGNAILENRSDGGPDTGPGIELASSDWNLVRGNRARGNDGPCVQLSDAHGNEVLANDVAGSNTVGLELFASHDNTVARNLVGGSEAGGIDVFSSDRNRIRRNRIIGDDLVLWQSHANTVARNEVLGRLAVRAGANDVLRRNRVRGSPGDGIFVDDASTSTRLVQNEASENGDDGLDVEDPSASLGHNVARDNGDLGIEAVPGVIDLGGNEASGNGNPLQCLNVACE